MMFEIQSKNTLSGVTLMVQFPEKDLDQKALHTIQNDHPDFLVPFVYRTVDGMVECTYQIGSRNKLQYRCGDRTPDEYEKFWKELLVPLLECQDWFLNPFSFVLNTQYLYIDREDHIAYIYIPSKKEYADSDSLRTMVTALAQQNTVTDPGMENKVLRALMHDFHPREFLNMLRDAKPKVTIKQSSRNADQYPTPQMPDAVPMPEENIPKVVKETPKAPAVEKVPGSDDIVIDFGNSKKEKPVKSGFFGKKKEQDKKPKEKKGGLFGKKKEKEKQSEEILLGAAAQMEEPKPRQESAAVWTPNWEDDGVTYMEDNCTGSFFRLIGDASLPREIKVNIEVGQTFTIGRFDVSIGRPQSDFEFDRRTKAVSRRHAVIERKENGYSLIDLTSSAGTYVDGDRLTPNVPRTLVRGCRVSFGTGGADYIWEE